MKNICYVIFRPAFGGNDCQGADIEAELCNQEASSYWSCLQVGLHIVLVQYKWVIVPRNIPDFLVEAHSLCSHKTLKIMGLKFTWTFMYSQQQS